MSRVLLMSGTITDLISLKIGFFVARKAENGGDITYATYQELETSFANQEIHPADFKPAVEAYINKLLQPIRAEFDTPELK